MQSSDLGDIVRKNEPILCFTKWKDYICIGTAGLGTFLGGYFGLMLIPHDDSSPIVEERREIRPSRIFMDPAAWLERREERIKKEIDKAKGNGRDGSYKPKADSYVADGQYTGR